MVDFNIPLVKISTFSHIPLKPNCQLVLAGKKIG